MKPFSIIAVAAILVGSLGLGGCSQPGQRALPAPPPTTYPARVVEPPTTVPAELTFDGARVAAYGDLYLLLRKSPTIALGITCTLPKPAGQAATGSVGPHLRVRLALTREAVRSLTPTGEAPPPADPSEYEDAVAGTLTWEATDTPSEVLITLQDLRFRTTKIRQIGPLKVRLNNPFPA